MYYWMAGQPASLDTLEQDIDLVAVDRGGFVSVTPLQFDLTSQHELARLAPFFA